MAIVQGLVTDPLQRPLAGASIVFSGDANQDQDTVKTGSDGLYKTKPLKRGNYSWTASLDGFQTVSGTLIVPPKTRTVTAPPIVMEPAGSISGNVRDASGRAVQGIIVIGLETQTLGARQTATDFGGVYRLIGLRAGSYQVIAQAPAGFQQPAFQLVTILSGNVGGINFLLLVETVGQAGPTGPPGPPGPTGTTGTTGPTGPIGPTGPAGTGVPSGGGGSVGTGPTDGGLQPVTDFFAVLDSADFNLIGPISEPEAEEAITLFSVVSMLLAGKGERVVGGERKVDVLGVLTLFYGLQDRSLPPTIVVKSQLLFDEIDRELKSLRDELDQLGTDVIFLEREARRQFNLGQNNEVAGNAQFSRLFNRYVDIANDPLMFIDLRAEETSAFSDKEQLARAFDLLRELKNVVLQLVRSLSKFGTIATTRVNQNWAEFEGRAMVVLHTVAGARLSDDIDDQRPLVVLSNLTAQDLDTRILPYVALAREGGHLLSLAMEAYRATRDNLVDYSEESLLDLFQARGSVFLTTRMRRSAGIIRQFRLADWN
jgi:hypothetical protein